MGRIGKVVAPDRPEELAWLALETLSDGLWDWNIQSGEVYFSDAFLDMLGYSREEIEPTFQTWEDWLHPEDRAAAVQTIRKLDSREVGSAYRSEHRLRTKLGTWKWILDRGQVVERDATGWAIRAVGIRTDISHQKAEEVNVYLISERLRLATEAAFFGIWDSNLVTGEQFWNSRMFEIYGVTPVDFRGRPEDWFDRLHPDDAEWVETFLKETRNLRGTFQYRYRIVTPRGEIKWIKALGVIHRDSNDNPIRAIGINIDETAIRLREIEFEHKQNDLRKAEILARFGNWWWDFASDSVTWSEGLYAIFRLDASQPAPSFAAHSQLYSASDYQSLQQAAEKCREEGTPYDVELEAIRADGTPSFINVTGNAARNAQGQIIELYGTAQDITEQKLTKIKVQEAHDELLQTNAKLHAALSRAEGLTRAARAADQQRSSLLAVMSHEIRTPLNAILGMASLLETTPLSGEQGEYVETLSASGQSLAALLNDILDFSKLEAGKITLEQRPISLLNLAHETVMMFAGAARDKGVELIYTVESGFSDSIRGDFFRLKQILINLLSNAVKFTEHGGICLRLGTTPLADGRIRLNVKVEDTGIGISKRALENLFEPFQQADSSITRKFGGTGLGLAISEQLVGLMNGSINVKSEPGRGSEFAFSLELDSNLNPVPSQVCEGLRIVYRSESARNQEMLASLVAFLGGKLIPASSAAEIQELRPQILFKDTALFAETASEIPAGCKVVEVHGLGEKVASDRPKLTIPCSVKQLEDCLKRSLPDLRKTDPLHPLAPADLRILVAEDNKINQRVILLMLAKLGLAGDVVMNGAEALRELSAKKYDLVLMDLQMPDVDGITATHLWRTSEALIGGRVYICALTANATEADRQRCLEVGMDDYLSKPVVLAGLREMFERAARALEKWSDDAKSAE